MSANFKEAILLMDEQLKKHIAAGGKVMDISAKYQQQVIALVQAASVEDSWPDVAKDIAYFIFAGSVTNMLLPKVTDYANVQIAKVNKNSNTQSIKAEKPRGLVITEGGETIPIMKMIANHANHPEHKEETVPELWLSFQGVLDENGLDPEILPNRDCRKEALSYYAKNKRKKMTYGTFANNVSKVRA